MRGSSSPSRNVAALKPLSCNVATPILLQCSALSRSALGVSGTQRQGAQVRSAGALGYVGSGRSDPANDHGFVYNTKGQVDILQSPFFDFSPDVDHSVKEYVDRIIFQLAATIDVQLSSAQWLVDGNTKKSINVMNLPIPTSSSGDEIFQVEESDNLRVSLEKLASFSSLLFSPLGKLASFSSFVSASNLFLLSASATSHKTFLSIPSSHPVLLGAWRVPLLDSSKIFIESIRLYMYMYQRSKKKLIQEKSSRVDENRSRRKWMTMEESVVVVEDLNGIGRDKHLLVQELPCNIPNASSAPSLGIDANEEDEELFDSLTGFEPFPSSSIEEDEGNEAHKKMEHPSSLGVEEVKSDGLII
ncbi:hypothetical protein M5K25_015140 [Dendrobium thyrsiflorum]|uniref:Uncharacterized protein n=1 Tax=Dendrobium thyrsiflorum TaxID=117978 RepID=A0ABD0UPJ5_DENTH